MSLTGYERIKKDLIVIVFCGSFAYFLILAVNSTPNFRISSMVEESGLKVICSSGQRDLFVRRDNGTWLEALEMCTDSNDNQSIASYEFYNSTNHTTILRDLNGDSAWLYGIEGIETNYNSTPNFRISSMVEESGLKVICSNEQQPEAEVTYEQSSEKCNSSKELLSIKNRSIFHVILNMGFYGKLFWIKDVNETAIIQDKKTNATVRCLLLDENGNLRSDSCDNKHRVICVNDILKPTLKYVKKDEIIATYDKPTSVRPSTTVVLTTGTAQQGVTDISQSPTPTRSIRATNLTTDDDNLDKEMQYTIITGSVAVLLIIIIIVICCLACRRNSKTSGTEPKLSEVYSDAADSVVIRRVSNVERKSTDYATPEDAIGSQKALDRTSVTGGEYDVLNKQPKAKSSPKEHLNVYNHIQIKQTDTALAEDNTYDLTSYAKDKANTLQTSGHSDTYGHVIIQEK